MAMIPDIAKRAGVSINTVRRVLRGGNKEIWPSAAAERGKRIRAIAASSSRLRIPQDLSLVTFHAEPVFSTGIDMKVYRVPMEEVGEAGVSLLLEKIDRPHQRLEAQRIRYRTHTGRVLPPMDQ